MYLLNTSTLQLEQPRNLSHEYAILSHVWGEEEVTFRDINGPDAANLRGYTKIKRCCAQARADGYKYAWIDTCCIDKSSSAELSEAINSMYRWYEDAAVCYAYLADVPSDENPADECSRFRNSRYFKRGWTLQEVIASKIVEFFAEDWIKIATRESETSVIAEVTGVDRRVLSKRLSLANVSVAKKMSWASERETTRVEDRAYSLMGIFGVHMPLLYGEGEHAFIRLQHEIMRTSNDQSIFAWGYGTQVEVSSNIEHLYNRVNSAGQPLFASSPSDFRGCAKVDQILPSDFLDLFDSSLSKYTSYKSHFSMTNSGVQITLPIKRTDLGYMVALACVDTSKTGSCFIWLDLNLDQAGIFRRFGIGCTAKRGLFDDYFLKDIIITHKDKPPCFDHARGLPQSTESPPSRVNLDFRLAIQEGFILCSSLPVQEPYPVKPEVGMWNWTSSGVECILAFRYETSEAGFIVTIGRWSHDVCVHVASVLDVDRCSGIDPLSELSSPPLTSLFSHSSPLHSTSLPSDIDTGYDRPDHASRFITRFRGCESAPDWASRPLPLGKRVTVTCLRAGPYTYNVTIAVHPNVHRCADEESQTQSQRLPAVRVNKVRLLEARRRMSLSGSKPRRASHYRR
ncbi:HET-domain-containing protein [Leucogyrophana mollusca]|uniref:HET-domain-containing protein n=1 Tax=Leucogyrophana mollusca TaxID=85980 RepID=A0ACB8B2U2_9AGAM|nr:HET-domain-containing protein [Leucogyrophana mollusca]